MEMFLLKVLSLEKGSTRYRFTKVKFKRLFELLIFETRSNLLPRLSEFTCKQSGALQEDQQVGHPHLFDNSSILFEKTLASSFENVVYACNVIYASNIWCGNRQKT